MTQKIPPLFIPENASKREKIVISYAYEVVKEVFENHKKDSVLDFNALMLAACYRAEEIVDQELEMIGLITQDKEKFNINWINQHEIVLKAFKRYLPNAIEELEMIDAYDKVLERGKENNRDKETTLKNFDELYMK